MSGRVERWLHHSERTPDRTVDERVEELLEAIRRGAQRNKGDHVAVTAGPSASSRR